MLTPGAGERREHRRSRAFDRPRARVGDESAPRRHPGGRVMTGSVWIDARRSASGPLADHVQADVVVVGAGITGAVTAWRLADAGHEVVLLEGRRAGEGNTGRSTGNL